MEKGESPVYWSLFVLSLALGAAALVTLIPNAAAAKPNVLGYRSVCSFAPAATALCGLLAGLTCTIRNRLFSRQASSMRHRPLIIPVGIGLILLVIAAVFGIRFGAAQSRFQAIIQKTGPVSESTLADGIRRGSFREGEVAATVEVTVNAGRIDSMTLVSGTNVDEALARTMFSRVKAAGTTNVDAVSGATASSNVLLKAVASAAAGQ
jgi:uncharacterized protein with FMN-binding domain